LSILDFFKKTAGIQQTSAKKAPRGSDISRSNTFNPSGNTDSILGSGTYREHLRDLLVDRVGEDSRALLRRLFRTDPDLSGAVSAYLTLAASEPLIVGYNELNEVDHDITKFAINVMNHLFQMYDYSEGYDATPSRQMFEQEMRYLLLLRGAVGIELVLMKDYVPSHVTHVDMATIEWKEPSTGTYKPQQRPLAGGGIINMDIPTFFTAYYKRDPLTPYPESDFVAAINTIAARQQVVNDLYRIMQITGYPRIAVKVIESVLRKNMPTSLARDITLGNEWVASQLTAIANQFSDIRADQPIIYTDTQEIDVINKDAPGASLQISEVIELLNNQNQAATKTVATVLGRGKGSINTASTESRLFAKTADQLNLPLSQVFNRLLTFCLHLSGTAGRVEVTYPPTELRPKLELEPWLSIKAARLKSDLSLGIISDTEYHLELYGRLPNKDSPVLSGTGFATVAPSVDVENISPNEGSLQRDLTGEGTEASKSNTNKQ
jgi:hypothetical protein